MFYSVMEQVLILTYLEMKHEKFGKQNLESSEHLKVCKIGKYVKFGKYLKIGTYVKFGKYVKIGNRPVNLS